jgi:hypothetical protein
VFLQNPFADPSTKLLDAIPHQPQRLRIAGPQKFKWFRSVAAELYLRVHQAGSIGERLCSSHQTAVVVDDVPSQMVFWCLCGHEITPLT